MVVNRNYEEKPNERNVYRRKCKNFPFVYR